MRVVRTTYRAPNMNAIAEGWVRSVKSECLDRLALFGEGMLRRASRDCVAHCNRERPHQGSATSWLPATRRPVRRRRAKSTRSSASVACGAITGAWPDGSSSARTTGRSARDRGAVGSGSDDGARRDSWRGNRRRASLGKPPRPSSRTVR